jgi:hypothetical protein
MGFGFNTLVVNPGATSLHTYPVVAERTTGKQAHLSHDPGRDRSKSAFCSLLAPLPGCSFIRAQFPVMALALITG